VVCAAGYRRRLGARLARCSPRLRFRIRFMRREKLCCGTGGGSCCWSLFGACCGSQFSLALVIPVLLALMLYLAPRRRSAALVILSTASAFGLALLFADYFSILNFSGKA
jgi:hypothetical protein